ncbi:hypothetical protein CXG81DRAFT_20611 [Caulochytrium protostelioides]|uniref:BRO1 domain-containing protein n=1 Tax=Caulochytrium protostelioides TaxID=1555241 RepID=A0A4P9X2X3_9FUNG|nr:hypothetical protein CXG81DRAFT_20611 [Caulochytrium protostelioides]|eukprot:RKO99286.1 hypothetical protein CXG81DRAFT_20611 [Caulochytrium protostelioides]
MQLPIRGSLGLLPILLQAFLKCPVVAALPTNNRQEHDFGANYGAAPATMWPDDASQPSWTSNIGMTASSAEEQSFEANGNLFNPSQSWFPLTDLSTSESSVIDSGTGMGQPFSTNYDAGIAGPYNGWHAPLSHGYDLRPGILPGHQGQPLTSYVGPPPQMSYATEIGDFGMPNHKTTLAGDQAGLFNYHDDFTPPDPHPSLWGPGMVSSQSATSGEYSERQPIPQYDSGDPFHPMSQNVPSGFPPPSEQYAPVPPPIPSASDGNTWLVSMEGQPLPLQDVSQLSAAGVDNVKASAAQLPFPVMEQPFPWTAAPVGQHDPERERDQDATGSELERSGHGRQYQSTGPTKNDLRAHFPLRAGSEFDRDSQADDPVPSAGHTPGPNDSTPFSNSPHLKAPPPPGMLDVTLPLSHPNQPGITAPSTSSPSTEIPTTVARVSRNLWRFKAPPLNLGTSGYSSKIAAVTRRLLATPMSYSQFVNDIYLPLKIEPNDQIRSSVIPPVVAFNAALILFCSSPDSKFSALFQESKKKASTVDHKSSYFPRIKKYAEKLTSLFIAQKALCFYDFKMQIAILDEAVVWLYLEHMGNRPGPEPPQAPATKGDMRQSRSRASQILHYQQAIAWKQDLQKLAEAYKQHLDSLDPTVDTLEYIRRLAYALAASASELTNEILAALDQFGKPNYEKNLGYEEQIVKAAITSMKRRHNMIYKRPPSQLSKELRHDGRHPLRAFSDMPLPNNFHTMLLQERQASFDQFDESVTEFNKLVSMKEYSAVNFPLKTIEDPSSAADDPLLFDTSRLFSAHSLPEAHLSPLGVSGHQAEIPAPNSPEILHPLLSRSPLDVVRPP